jgi:hypothetical protein
MRQRLLDIGVVGSANLSRMLPAAALQCINRPHIPPLSKSIKNIPAANPIRIQDIFKLIEIILSQLVDVRH